MDKSMSLHSYHPLSQLKSFQAQLVRIAENPIVLRQDQETKLCTSSRKILKKRSRYNKINDEIRLKLVEAVEKNGEMLKSAAKKFKVNYSSAKSIFQTYRKEGRVLRKTNKTRRPTRGTSLVKTESTHSKIEETSPVRSHTDTPILEMEHQIPQLKPLQHYLSPPKPQSSSLDNLGHLLTGVDFTIKRNVDELKRLLAPTYSQLVATQQLRNEPTMPMLGQAKIGTLLDSYPMMQQPQFSPCQGPVFQPNYHNLAEFIQNPQYPYIKNYQESVRLETLNLLMKQVLASKIGPTLP